MRTRNYLAQSASLALHALGLLALLFLMNRAAAGVDPAVQPLDSKHLVYVASPGLGGGGGGSKTPAPRVEAEISAARPVPAVPVAVASPIDPLPSVNAPVVTNAASILTASGVDGRVNVPFGGGGNGNGIGPGKGDGAGPGDGTGFDGGKAGEGGISWPERIREVKPQYTADAMRLKIQGSVLIQAVLGVDGKILDARVVRSLDAIYGLDQAALKAVLATPMRPCKKAGQAVVCVVPFELQFTLR
jgi:periplasmic protein TonB